MKRLVTLALVVAFLVGTVGMVKAAQLTISGGDFRVHGNYVDNPNFDGESHDKINFYQRFRTNFNFVANENLRAVVQLQFNMGERWGADYIGGNAQDVNFRQAYLQFNIPNTQAQVKAGWHWLALPNTLGSHIYDARSTGFTVSSPINDTFAVTAGFARTHDIDDGTAIGNDERDHYFLIVPVTLDGFAINPFFWLVSEGKGFTAVQPAQDKARNIFFGGINFTMDLFDPIVVHADFNYGTASKQVSGTKTGQTEGWIANLAVAYKMDMMTPMIFALYESGESKSSGTAAKAGRIMPNLAGDLNFSSFGFAGGDFGGTANNRLGLQGGANGKLALGLKVTDISFVDKLTHTFLVAYYQGTNHKDSGAGFTTKDNAWEVNFDHNYQVYENLAAILQLGFINVDPHKESSEQAWKAAAGFRYRF